MSNAVTQVVASVIATVVTGGVAAWAWGRRGRVRAAGPFALYTLAQALWNAGHAFEAAARTLAGKVAWDSLQVVPYAALAPLSLAVARGCLGRALPRWVVAVPAIVLAPLVAFVTATPLHGLLHRDAYIDPSTGVLLYRMDGWDLAMASVIYASLIVSGLLVARDRRAAHGRFAAQTTALSVALFGAPVLTVFAMATGVALAGDRDVSPVTTTLAAVVAAWGLARHGLFDVWHIGRDAVFDATADAVVVLDDQRRVVDLNAAATRLFGVAPGAFVPGVAARDLFGAWRAPLDVMVPGDAREVELEGDGGARGRWFTVAYAPLRDDGAALGGTLTFRDVTDRRRARAELELHVEARTRELNETLEALRREIEERRSAEQRLLQAQKMESIGRLAGGVAHDFNNVLTAMMGNADLAAQRTRDPEVAAALRSIRDAGELAASMTRQLLTFARRQPMSAQRIDLRASLAPAEQLLRRLLSENVVLEAELPTDVWPIHADATQLQQALINLAVNARDAMPDGGRLRVTADNVVVDGARAATAGVPPGDYVRLAVADDGVGMTDEVRQHLFEPFFTTKGEGRGTGLGLAVVHGFVHQAGGFVEVESAPGQGTTFALFFPRDTTGEPRAAALAPAAAATARDGLVVALVEDQDMVRAVIERVLARARVPVHAFSSGRELLRRLPALAPRPTLLLTDVVMPDTNGFALADAVAAAAPGMKVMFMSGHSEEVLGGALGNLDPSLLLPKPFGPRELLDRIATIAARADAWSPRQG